MCCTCLQVCLFLFKCLSVSLVGDFTLQFKYKVQISGRTEVNYGLSLPVILKDLLPSSQIFAGIYGAQSRNDLLHYLKWEQSSRSNFNSSNGKWSVFRCLKNNSGEHIILRLIALSKLKRICMQFARKMHARISDAKLGNSRFHHSSTTLGRQRLIYQSELTVFLYSRGVVATWPGLEKKRVLCVSHHF